MNFLDTAFRKTHDKDVAELSYLALVTVKSGLTNKGYDKTIPSSLDLPSDECEEIALQIKKDVIKLEHFTSSASNTEEGLQKMKDVDKNFIPEFYINQRLNQDHLRKKEQKLYNLYRSLGAKTEESVLLNNSKYKKLLKWIFPKLDFPVYLGGLSEREILRLLVPKIIISSNTIAVKSRRGPGNFIVLNGQMGAYLQDHPSLVFNNPNTLLDSKAGQITCIGTFTNANMKVFVNPYLKWNDNLVLVGRNTTNNNPGVVCLEGDITENRLVDEGTVIQSVSQLLAIKEYGDYPEDYYMTINFNMNKKPLWRKLLNI